MKIRTILDKIDEKQLFVPAFQREYVWKKDDAKQLVDSLIKEYPTGTMLTWETSKPPELKGPHQYEESQGSVKLILDGQQRITTLYMLIKGVLPPYYTESEILNDTRGLYVNLDTLELSYYIKTRMENNPFWQNVTHIFKGELTAFDLQGQFEKSDNPISMDDLKKLNSNINAVTQILDRFFPEQIIPPKAQISEAIEIFYKVNASGVALTDAELALAQISGYWPKARERFKKKLAQLESEGFGFSLDFIVYVLLGCLYHMGSDMRKLHGSENLERIQSAWERLESHTLDYVINLLRSKAFVDHRWEINSVYALVPIIVYCFDKGKEHLTDLEIKRVIKWFYYSQIRTRYVSQLPQKLDQDLKIVAEAENPFDSLLQGIEAERRLEIVPDEMVGRSISHPLFSLMRWYHKSQGAVCFTTGVELRQNMGARYQLENDHIFPYSRLKQYGYGMGNRVKYALAQEFTNRAILTQTANRSKSNTKAIEYLRHVRERFPQALKLQSIPEDENLWDIENYEQFLEARREILATRLNAFLEGITETEETVVPISLEEMIADGESDELELKATLRWDLRQNSVNKKLEDVIVKTIAAFANGDGGTLLIGVEDDGSILGLGHDYLSLGEGTDKDKFELHLRNLLVKQIGAAFVASKLQTTFPEVDEKEICRIDVQRSNAPIVIKVKDKNGQVFEKLYVRSGNSSPEMPLSEVSSYLRDRFK